jgi:YesN/AraC family two-component response regulator
MAEERKAILIVEDESDTATYLSTLLEDAGYSTVAAEDGDRALERVKASRPDLITLISADFEKFISTRRHVPPPEGYLSKPIDQEQMLSLVKEQIGS